MGWPSTLVAAVGFEPMPLERLKLFHFKRNLSCAARQFIVDFSLHIRQLFRI